VEDFIQYLINWIRVFPSDNFFECVQHFVYINDEDLWRDTIATEKPGCLYYWARGRE
jgi:hypothetical protein